MLSLQLCYNRCPNIQALLKTLIWLDERYQPLMRKSLKCPRQRASLALLVSKGFSVLMVTFLSRPLNFFIHSLCLTEFLDSLSPLSFAHTHTHTLSLSIHLSCPLSLSHPDFLFPIFHQFPQFSTNFSSQLFHQKKIFSKGPKNRFRSAPIFFFASKQQLKKIEPQQ